MPKILTPPPPGYPRKDGSAPRRKPLALVVEDEPAMQSSLREIMYEAGCSSLLATNVSDARSVIASGSALDIIILDLSLDGENGRDLLEDFASRAHPPPIVIVSGNREAPKIAEEFNLVFVKKPFDLEQVTLAVAQAFREQRRPSKRASRL